MSQKVQQVRVREHIWTPEELAEYMSVSITTVYRLLHNDDFPGAFRIGQLWRIPESALAAFLEAKAVKQKS